MIKRTEFGVKFGKLTIQEEGEPYQNGNRRYWCLCECGTKKLIGVSNLRAGQVLSCGCSTSEFLSAIDRSSKKKVGTAMRRKLYYYKKGAKTRGLDWKLSDKEFQTITQSPCYYTGRPPAGTVSVRSGDTFIYNGIDRVDSSIGYTPQNSVPCCSDANYAKSDFTVEEFLSLVKEIYEHLRLDQGLPKNTGRPLVENG